MRLLIRVITSMGTMACTTVLLAACVSAIGPTPREATETNDSEESPLSAFFTSSYGGELSPAEKEKKFSEDQRERENLVARCMTQKGFKYAPNIQNMSIPSSASEEVWELDSHEWVAQYGYGVINYPGRDETFVSEDSGYKDINDDYVKTLTDWERQAFYEALYGPDIDGVDTSAHDAAIEWDWSAAGCSGWAEHERIGEDPTVADEHQPLMEALNNFSKHRDSSPALAAIDADWHRCMINVGEPSFTTQVDAPTNISAQLNALNEGSPEISLDDPAIVGLGKREIELALKDLNCREETRYRSRVREVHDKQEQQFIDDHLTELEPLRGDIERIRQSVGN